MKSLESFLSGFRLKNIIPSVAQLLLAVLILPVLCFILKLLAPDGGWQFISRLVDEVGIMETWFSLTGDYVRSLGAALTTEGYIAAVISPLPQIMLEEALMGMCIYLLKTIGTMLFIRGVPVLQTVLGVFLGCITIRAAAVDESGMYTIAAIAFLIVANIVLTIFTAGGQPLQKVLSVFLGIGLSVATAGMGAAYIAALAQIANGYVTDIKVCFALIGFTLCPLLIVLLADYFLLAVKK